jgi:hypothetical protein
MRTPADGAKLQSRSGGGYILSGFSAIRGGRELVYRKARAVPAAQAAAGGERPRVNVVVNWFDELRAKVPR